jgi:hypothetical protein
LKQNAGTLSSGGENNNNEWALRTLLSGDGEKLDVRELEMRNRELREHVR